MVLKKRDEVSDASRVEKRSDRELTEQHRWQEETKHREGPS